MKIILIATLFLASSVSATAIYGAISSQYHSQDQLGQYSYGYADPNSQKQESRSHDGVTRGSYSYVDANGHVQSVAYTADPHNGFNAVGTNLPKGPEPVHPVAVAAVHAPLVYASHAAYAHAPVALTHQGVPVETPEVQHAKAAHFAAHAAALSGHHLAKRSVWGAAPWAQVQHVPVIHNGVPVETPEVQHAKAAHFAAHAKALAQNHYAPAPWAAQPSGAPADTPEVAHAKAEHYAAHAAASAGHPIHAASHGYHHVPVIHNGVPIDEPAVQHAKAAHFRALAEASHGAHYSHAPIEHYGHLGPIHIPVIHNGVPVDTPEVQHARAAHLSALAAAGGVHHESHHFEDDGQYHHHYDSHY